MRRRALAAAVLAAVSATSPSAADGNKVTYTCGTAPETIKRADGRVNTWNLSAFSFTPDNRSTRPLLIRYRSITRLEYGRTPPRPVETDDTAPITLPCALKPERKDYYLTIFYKEEVPDDEDEKKATSESKEQRDKKTQARQDRQDRSDRQDRRDRVDRRDRLEPWDSKNRTDPKDRNQKTSANRRAQRDQKNAGDRRDQRDGTDRKDVKADNDRKDESDQKDVKDESGAKKEKEYFAVFELGDGVLRPALRILETRSGKRVNFQDANARKAAR
jgi:hypothetical protein